MRKLDEKVSNAVHIKRHTRGTSNEISFSVLDAAKNSQNESASSSRPPHHPILGAISMFTLNHRKKPIATPRREHGLTLSTGEFVSAEPLESRSPRESSLDQGNAKTDGVSNAGQAADRSDDPRADEAPELRRREARSGGRSGESSSWALSREEVAHRKAKRKRAKRVAVSACAVVIAALCAIGVTAIAKSYQKEQDGRARLSEVVASISSSYEEIEEFEALVTSSDNPLSQVDAEALVASLEEMDDDLTALRVSLESDRTRLESLGEELENNGDKEACNEAIAVANAGVNMIDAGRLIINEVVSAAQAYKPADEGWKALLAGDTSARDAAQRVKETSVETVEDSSILSQTAIEKFEEAVRYLTEAQTMYGIDMAPFIEYLNVRIEAQHRALESDRAYLDRNKEEASSANDAYNQLDAQAVEMAKALDNDPPEIVESKLTEQISSCRASFAADWARVKDGHVVISEYLGRISK